MKKMLILGALLLATIVPAHFYAQARAVTVQGQVTIVGRTPPPRSPDDSNVVVWLEPLDESARTAVSTIFYKRLGKFQLVQKNKRFEPHLLVVPVGSVVEFPNRDPFFHNVFSLFEGQRFDLGLYESGATRTVLFDRPGVCYIFCNIHAEMSAVVVVVKTPYYGVTDRRGQITIPNVPPGRYHLKVWNERSLPKALDGLSREVLISREDPSLGNLRVDETGYVQLPHKNLYGQDYVPPTPKGSIYNHR